MRNLITRSSVLAFISAASLLCATAADNPFLGSWELTFPGGGAGWLGVEKSGGGVKAEILWIAGSVEPTASAKVDGDKLILTRNHEIERKDANGKKVKTNLVETIVGTVNGDTIRLSSVTPKADGSGQQVVDFSGKRTPPMPPAPDLSKVNFGAPIKLFNGKDLMSWRLTDPGAVNGWSVQDGLLVNNPVQEDGKPHKNYGNLRTDQEFEDFNLKVEVKADKGQNSGVYLRGMYEVQVMDSYSLALDSHHMGAVYSRIKPTAKAEKPPGEWQTLDITLVDRHVTVIFNGKKTIDNQPVAGCTGGALSSDVSRPGPIYLQGDHTGITYRSLVLKPVTK